MRHVPKYLFGLSLVVLCTCLWGWAFYRHAFWGFVALIGLVCAAGALVLIHHFKKRKDMTPENERLTMNLIAAFCTLAVLVSFQLGFHWRAWKDMRKEKREAAQERARLPRAFKQ